MEQQHGLLVVDKPRGLSSAQCTNRFKRLGQKKIGHAGTLDPMAQGVLLVLLGHATKISGYLMAGGVKAYQGTVRLGQTTDTWDADGQITAEAPWNHVTAEAVADVIAGWVGTSEQPVPPYSAAKHQGQPLYKLSREGKETPLKIKTIEISRAEVLRVELPYVTFRVICSSGTYIRSLAHSLGTRLGCGAVLTELTREYSHPFGLDVAHDPADFTADPTLLPGCVRPIAEALPHWRKVELTPDEAARVRNGIAVPCRPEAPAQADAPEQGATGAEPAEGFALLLEQGTALALAQLETTPAGPCWTVLRGLWN